MLQIKSKLQSGFTIIELLIVIAIIGILATLVLTNFQGAQARGRDTVRKNDANSVYSKLEEFYNENGGYPDATITDDGANVTVDGAPSATAAVAAANGPTAFPGIDSEAWNDEDGDDFSMSFITGTVAPTPSPDNDTEYTLAMYDCAVSGSAATLGSTCNKYVLAVFQETDAANDYTKQSLN
jgi:prepilin-type N-terminal cleavage/methylation domain-containing protein